MAADDKKAEPIELVAIERGFVMGRLVEPGTKFKFRPFNADGSTRKIPKWAQLASKPIPARPPHVGDLKPTDAQAAVAKKAMGTAGF